MNTRQEWLQALLKIVSPILDALSEGRLKETLPLDFHADRASFAPLEAFGRSMLGLAPWLEAGPPIPRLRTLCCFTQEASPWWTRPFWRMPFYARPAP